MAKGWDGVEQTTQAREAQKAEFDQGFLPELRVNKNNTGPFVVRFLEQGPDVNNFPVHEYKVPKDGGGFRSKKFTCLQEINQPCPGCAAGMRVKRRGVYNLIQRGRPVYRKGQDGKVLKVNGEYVIDGYQDTVVVANVGSLTAEMLRKADGQYQGLMSRDFVIVFSGDDFQAWNMTPAIDAAGNAMATPMSDVDHQLAAQKHNIDEYMKPPTAEKAQQIINQYGGNSGAQSQGQGGYGAPPAQGGQHGPGVAPAGANGFQAPPVGQPTNALGAIAGQPPVAPGQAQQQQPQQGEPIQPPPPAPVQPAAQPVQQQGPPPSPAPIQQTAPGSTPAPAPAPAPVQQQ